MQMASKKAFTMIELVFVIVVIGILSAIAIPKFAATRDDATITKALATVAAVRSALATERQKRILRGEFADINKSAIGDDSSPFKELLNYPVKLCNTSSCNGWVIGGTDAAPEYTFKGPQGVDTLFTLQSNRLNCTSGCGNFE